MVLPFRYIYFLICLFKVTVCWHLFSFCRICLLDVRKLNLLLSYCPLSTFKTCNRMEKRKLRYPSDSVGLSCISILNDLHLEFKLTGVRNEWCEDNMEGSKASMTMCCAADHVKEYSDFHVIKSFQFYNRGNWIGNGSYQPLLTPGIIYLYRRGEHWFGPLVEVFVILVIPYSFYTSLCT